MALTPRPLSAAWLHVKFGANTHPLETVLLYLFPIFLFCLFPLPAPVRAFLVQNACVQLAVFVPLVQIPLFFTSKLSYVDVGWPLGVALLGAQVFALAWGVGAGAGAGAGVGDGSGEGSVFCLRQCLVGVAVLVGGVVLVSMPASVLMPGSTSDSEESSASSSSVL